MDTPLTDGLLRDAKSIRQLGRGPEPRDSVLCLHNEDSKACFINKSSLLNQKTSKLYTMGTLGERIRYARERAGLDQAGLAKLIGVSKSAVNQWELDKTKNLRLDNLFKLERATGFAAMWIGIAEGPMKRGDNTQDRPARQSSEHQPETLIHNEWMLDVLDSITELWGELPGDNDYLSNLITDGYNKLVLDIRESDRARLKSVVTRSLREKYKGAADGGGNARKSPGEADHD